MDYDGNNVAVVTGSSSGLGLALARRLELSGWTVHRFSKLEGHDLTDEFSVCKFADRVARAGKVDALINCAGVNYINWFEELPYDEWDRLMNTNAGGIFMMTKELILAGAFASPAAVCNIVSNASHMPMTHSAAYNASKGAAHILTLQMARELRKRHNLTVFGVSPNKMKGTAMSEYIGERVCELRGWTPEQAEAYQLAALPAGEETDPEACAEFIAFLLSSRDRHKYLAGCILPYGA